MQQVPQPSNSPPVLHGVGDRRCAVLAELQTWLHGCLSWIAVQQATSFQELLRICSWAKSGAGLVLMNFNTQIVGKQTEITHTKYLLHLRLERHDVVVPWPVMIKSLT
jgi:hypothetical protein